MCEYNEKELEQNEDNEEYMDRSEEVMGQIAVQEELKRIDIQENPKTITNECTKKNNFYKDSMITIETVGEAFQKLLGYGIDYNNALAIASGLVVNESTLKQLKLQATIQENNQP